MRNALIAFASRHGQTERIAQRMAKVMIDGGMSVDVVDLRRTRRPPTLDGYGVVILAGSIQFGRHPRKMERFARDNRAALAEVVSVLVSVSGAAITPAGIKEAERLATDFSRRTGWTPRRTLLAGGAFPYTRYNPLLRWMMRRIAGSQGFGTDTSRDYEYTHWPEIDEFARALLPLPAEAMAS